MGWFVTPVIEGTKLEDLLSQRRIGYLFPQSTLICLVNLIFFFLFVFGYLNQLSTERKSFTLDAVPTLGLVRDLDGV